MSREEITKNFLDKSKYTVIKEEAAQLQKEIADFINSASIEDLGNAPEYSRAIAAYITAGALISDGTDAGKQARKERILKILETPPTLPYIDLNFVKKCSYEALYSINEEKFLAIKPFPHIAATAKIMLTGEVLLTHIATELAAEQLTSWLEEAAKISAASPTTLQDKLNEYVKTFIFGQAKPEGLQQEELKKCIDIIKPDHADTHASFTKATILTLLKDAIKHNDDKAKLESIKNILEKTAIEDKDLATLKDQLNFIADKQLRSFCDDAELRATLLATVTARLGILNKPAPAPAPAPASTPAAEMEISITLEHIFKNFKKTLTGVHGITFESNHKATITDSNQKKTTIEKIALNSNGSGAVKVVSASRDAIVDALVQVYIADLLASTEPKKLERSAEGELSAVNGYKFSLSPDVFSLNRKNGSEVTKDERAAFLAALDKKFSEKLPGIYETDSLTKESAAPAANNKDDIVRSRIPFMGRDSRPSVHLPKQKDSDSSPGPAPG